MPIKEYQGKYHRVYSKIGLELQELLPQIKRLRTQLLPSQSDLQCIQTTREGRSLNKALHYNLTNVIYVIFIEYSKPLSIMTNHPEVELHVLVDRI